jgi:hypothetical protein
LAGDPSILGMANHLLYVGCRAPMGNVPDEGSAAVLE